MPPRIVTIACLAAAVLGCSSRYEDAWSRARPRTFPAAGTVEHGGKPIAGALVNFMIELPDPRRPDVAHSHQAVGYTDSRGEFRLKTFREGDGAVAGTHQVRIAIPHLVDPLDPAPQEPAPTLPSRYGSFETSGLTAEVTASGTNHFVFELAD
jgi:hypothetical protein